MSVVAIPQHLVEQMEPGERAAYKLYLERQLAITDIWTYIQTVSPWVEPYPNILVLCGYLDALTEGRLYKDGPGPPPVCVGTRMERSGKRIVEVPIMQHPETGEEPVYNLAIYEPPRHGKSLAVSEHYPGYVGTKFPGTKIANASYGDDLAAELSSLLQTHVEEGRSVFGMGVEGGTKAGKYRWKFENGSDYLCGGRGSGFSGFGWMLGIADDLFKDRADSDSLANRKTVHGWWTSTWWTRRERWFDRTPARAVLMNTRWHPDDISGRIVEGSNKWCVLRIPALAEEGEIDVLGREPGEALIPEIMPAHELEEIRAKSPLDFASLYQGRPYLTGGNILHGPFNTCTLEGGNYKLVFESGETLYVPEAMCFRFQIIDLAASKKTTADWTVIGTFDITPIELGPRRMILRAMKRMRITTENHEGEVVAEYRRYNAKFIGVEDKTYGTNLIGQLKRKPGITVRALKADADKVTRALPLDTLLKNEELWWMAEAAFRMDLELEVLQFPDSDHDDQVDVLAYAGRVFQSLPRAKKPPKREPSGMNERVAAHLAKMKRPKKRGFNHPVLGSM